jgi:ABC-type Fe3+ transport system substrate-binding protein
MDAIKLTDPEIFPTPEVLKVTLGGSYQAYEKLAARFQEYGLDYSWNYYKDGKAWLC